jgi:acetyl/propionyl-CoA carboxylase alpha subunit
MQATSAQTPDFRPKALVLGNHGIAGQIARSLAKAGFDPRLPSELGLRIPKSGELDAVESMKRALGEFKAWADEACDDQELPHLLHPGVSPWAERPEICLLGQELGLDVIAPSPRTINLFRNRLTFFAECESLGIPNLLLSANPMDSIREIQTFAGHKPFPFVLKAARGGGGLSLFAAKSMDDVEAQAPLWLEQLIANSGESMVIAERYIEEARLVSVPFARFWNGRIEVFSPVDASLLCRNRKVIEFCPALKIDDEVMRTTTAWSRSLAERSGYVGVGVFEFLVDGSRAFVTGALPRLNTAYKLWERIDGIDAVEWQLATIGSGAKSEVPPKTGSELTDGIAVRLYCEDPVLGIPQPGYVHGLSSQREWTFPEAKAELALAIKRGEEVQLWGDGNIGTLFSFAKSREQSLALARGLLNEVWIAGALNTNQNFCLDLLNHPWVREGVFSAQFVDEEFVPEIRPAQELMPYFVSLCAFLGDNEPGDKWAAGDQWVKPDTGILKWVGEPKVFERDSGKGIEGEVELPPVKSTKFCAFPVLPGRWQVRIGEWAVSVRRVRPTELEKRKTRPMRIASMVNGKVRSVLFRKGALVKAHDPVLIVESLCQLIPHALPMDVTIVKWEVSPEETVKCGQILAQVEAINPLAD